jgi:hypothetical protein
MQLPNEMQLICSIRSTQNRCKNIEYDNKTQDLDCYVNTDNPYILYQHTQTTTNLCLQAHATYTTSGSTSR